MILKNMFTVEEIEVFFVEYNVINNSLPLFLFIYYYMYKSYRKIHLLF